MDWYYAQEGRQAGPVSEADLAQLHRSGVITPDTLVWHSGMTDWQAYRTVSGPPQVPWTPPAVPAGRFVYGGFRNPWVYSPFFWSRIGQIQLTSLAVTFCYFVFFWVYGGATPGKMIFKLRVVNPAGGPITWGQAIGRYFAQILSGLILCIGFIMAGFDDQKRALHDRLADTRVISGA